jgi:hypothetical protein
VPLTVTRAALAVALFLAISAPAHAGGTLFDGGTQQPASSPKLAGERVVWAMHSPDGIALNAAGHDGSGRTTHTFGGRFPDGANVFLQLAASPFRLAASLDARYCVPACKYQNYQTLFRATVSGPPGEAPQRLEPDCTPSDETPRVDVWEHVVAYRDACTRRTVVRDFAAAPGEPDTFEYPAALVIQVAGPYLLTREDDALVLREWRTGAERFRYDQAPMSWALQPDGKVALVRGVKADTYLLWRSATDPHEHIVAADVQPGVLMADDMIVTAPKSGGVAVRRLDGSLVAASEHAGMSDFDGRRLAWGDRACAVFGVMTWDLRDTAPRMPAGKCPFAGNRREVLRADFSRASGPERNYGTTSTLLECPSEPPLGCIGRLRMVAPDARPGRSGRTDMAYGGFALAPGEKREVQLSFGKRRVCIAGRGATRPVLEISSYKRGGGPEQRMKRRRVTLTGIKSRMCKQWPVRSS